MCSTTIEKIKFVLKFTIRLWNNNLLSRKNNGHLPLSFQVNIEHVQCIQTRSPQQYKMLFFI